MSNSEKATPPKTSPNETSPNKRSANKTSRGKLTAIREPYTKARLFAAISEETGLSKKDVAAVFDAFVRILHRHLKKRAAGEMNFLGLAKFKVSTRKASKARSMVHPVTGEKVEVPAKPAHRIVRIRALKAVKDMAETP